MSTLRTEKISQLMHEVLAETFRKEMGRTFPKNVLITVSKVTVTTDLSMALVYLSIFPFDQVKPIMHTIKEEKGLIKKELGKELGKQMRRIPDLDFRIDDSLERIDIINKEIKGQGNNPIL